MATETDSLTPTARTFLEETTLKSLLGIPERALAAVMTLAYQLYRSRRYAETEILCRGLVAADHTAWWPYSLHAATLRRQGRLREALDALEQGLRQAPHQPKLLFMRGEIAVACEEQRKALAGAASITATVRPPAAT